MDYPVMYERHTLCTALGIINCSQAHYDASEGEETRAGRGRAIRRAKVDVEGLSHQNSIEQRNIYIRAIGQHSRVCNLNNIDELALDQLILCQALALDRRSMPTFRLEPSYWVQKENL